MTFSGDLQAFAKKVEQRTKDVFVGSVNGVRTSITEGSVITDAPGQPVDTGNLRGSWITEFPQQWVGEVSTNVRYAEAIEEGMGPHGPMTLRSGVGGFGSVKKTRANFQALVDSVVAEVCRD